MLNNQDISDIKRIDHVKMKIKITIDRAGFVPRNLGSWGANADNAPRDPKFFEGEFFFTHLCMYWTKIILCPFDT